MITKTIYKMSDDEYALFRDATLGIQCPDLTGHDCNLCPMSININWVYGKDPDFRCLLGMMERTLSNMEDKSNESKCD